MKYEAFILSGKTVIATVDKVSIIGKESVKLYGVKAIHQNARTIDWENLSRFSLLMNGMRQEYICSGVTDDFSQSYIDCIWANKIKTVKNIDL